mmetsp:Transcript_10844/g.36820  ORF Transcript_10844/g.36820 Transcript_10844/m.36820 type:complete len:1652 (+) Transcript_10844:467-5422(+)
MGWFSMGLAAHAKTAQAIVFVFLAAHQGLVAGEPVSDWLPRCAPECRDGRDLTGTLPTTIGTYGLTRLDVYINSPIHGTLPTELGDLTGLTRIWFHNNVLTGSLPTELCRLSNLEAALEISENSLTGSMPTCLGRLSKIEVLSLYANELRFFIPTEIGRMAGLDRLWLHRNSLNGTIPTQIGQMPSLRWLHLSDNSLIGPIPSEVGASGTASLQYLDLDGNALNGSVPTQIGRLTELRRLHLFGNALTGSIPTQIGACTQVADMALDSNSLTGHIPSEVARMAALEQLYLFSNSLSGSLPAAHLGGLTSLAQLRIYNNALGGPIPAELGLLSTSLLQILAYGNALTGTLPSELAKLTRLQTLNLADNRLFRDLDQGLDQLYLDREPWKLLPDSLISLDLSGNSLSGTVPEDIDEGLPKSLTFLSLANASLVGTLPDALERSGALVVLDLSRNAWSGTLPAFVARTTIEVETLEYCAAGKQPPNKLPALFCEDCPVGSFKAEEGQADCTTCEDALGDALRTTQDPGATSSDACVCPPGTTFAPFVINGKVQCACPAGEGFDEFGRDCVPCPVGQYKDAAGNTLCRQCADLGAADLTTAEAGASSVDDCICPAGLFRADGKEGGDVSCKACDAVSMDCSAGGASLESLVLRPGFFRASSNTTDVRRCPIPEACVGGDGTTPAPGNALAAANGTEAAVVNYCAPHHMGPYCALCEEGFYLDADRRCAACRANSVVLAVAMVVAVAAVVAGVAWLGRRYPATAVTAKVIGRSLLAFVQAVLLVDRAYGAVLPDAFSSFLEPFRMLSFDGLLSAGLSCYGFGGYHATLYAISLAPLGVFALSLAYHAWRLPRALKAGALCKLLLDACLPALLAAYVLLPSATTVIFSAWSFESIDTKAANQIHVLRADVSVVYDSPAHQGHLVPAGVAGAAYAAVPALIFAVLRRPDSPLRFLADGYAERVPWWEALESTRQLLLAGVTVVLGLSFRSQLDAADATPAQVTAYTSAAQIVFAIAVQVCFGYLAANVRPLESDVHHLVHTASHLALPLVQTFALANHLAALGGEGLLSEPLGAMMVAAVIAALALAPPALAVSAFRERAKTVLRDATTGARVRAVPPSDDYTFHAFLSHVWATGQDQVAVLKEALTDAQPGLRVFRDLDDLSDTGALEDLVRQTQVMVFFLSRGFFDSANCRREVLAAFRLDKPLVVVVETAEAHGGGSTAAAELRAECERCGDAEVAALAPRLFGDARAIVPWYREPAYGRASVLQVCEQLWRHGALEPAPPPTARGDAMSSLKLGLPPPWSLEPLMAASLAEAGLVAALQEHSLLSLTRTGLGRGTRAAKGPSEATGSAGGSSPSSSGDGSPGALQAYYLPEPAVDFAPVRLGWLLAARAAPHTEASMPFEDQVRRVPAAAAVLLLGPDTFGHGGVATTAASLNAFEIHLAGLAGDADALGEGPRLLLLPKGEAWGQRAPPGKVLPLGTLCEAIGVDLSRLQQLPDMGANRGGPLAAARDAIKAGNAVVVAWPKHPLLVRRVLAAVHSGLPLVTAILEGVPEAVSFRHVLHSAPVALREDAAASRALFGRIALPFRPGGAHEPVSLAALGGACRAALLGAPWHQQAQGRLFRRGRLPRALPNSPSSASGGRALAVAEVVPKQNPG